MTDSTICTQCGMHTQPKEYHPYAACLMFLACHDSRVVRANLRDVVAYNDKHLREGIRALADELENDNGPAFVPAEDGDARQYVLDANEDHATRLRALLGEGE